MAEYADRECEYCGVILPAYEFRRETQRQLVSSSHHHRSYTGVDGRHGSGGGSSSTYRYHSAMICPDCYSSRKRAQLRRFLFWVAVVAAGVAAAGWVLANRASGPATAAISSNTFPTTIAKASPGNVQAPVVVESAGADDSNQISQVDGQSLPPEGASLSAAPSSSNSTAATSSGTYQIADVQHRSIERALDAGKTKRWSTDDQSGYVLVSAAQRYADRTCRNVTVTTFNGQDQQQSPTVMWCQPSPGEDWAVAQ
ncbi:surface antigen [Stakelama sediminis]|uniref:Surface antigen n=1 Tax=Stakelama sediminis TaxID=463200 RepID=A0A840Z076_9SPHN|nr:surface antigen [Stakelama sediminis]